MPLRLLVVEDSAMMRGVIRKTIGLMDIPVENLLEAENGEEGLSLLREHRCDLVLADVNMPVMSGCEMVSQMKEDDSLKDIPVILLTGEGSSLRVAKIRSMGIGGYLRKPFTPEELRAVVQRAIQGDHTSEATRLLQSVVSEVLESMAFVFCEPEATGSARPEGGRLLRATMEFQGPFCGEVWLAASERLCSILTSNVLGVEKEEITKRRERRTSVRLVRMFRWRQRVP